MSTSSLLLVSSVLSSSLPPSPRVVQLVNAFLLPKTIDAAVYSNLQRVIRAHHASRPCSPAAFDFAAAKGHLAILRCVHQNRRGRCSPTALARAAANGHRRVVKWLYKKYEKRGGLDTDGASSAAARRGRAHVVKFLRRKSTSLGVGLALEAAAANNRLGAVKLLLPWALTIHRSHHRKLPKILEAEEVSGGQSQVERFSFAQSSYFSVRTLSKSSVLDDVLAAAAWNGHVRILRFLLESNYGATMDVTLGIQKAASGGHIDIVELLMTTDNPWSTFLVLHRVTSGYNPFPIFCMGAIATKASASLSEDNTEIMKLLLSKGNPSEFAPFLRDAVKSNNLSSVKMLLDAWEERPPLDHSILVYTTFALESAVKNGNAEIVKLLADRSSGVIVGPALAIAVRAGDFAMIMALSELATPQEVGDEAAKAAMCSHHELVEVLLSQSVWNPI
ncbi:hypothetical protein PHYPSEUDO_014816 [Phytophthora pseudosyringae]|uniref:Uncharacterized protein n=1 Tax=Phytophthora pseudosyringae TaxID=221518 RepID=A0A8T1W1D3_9STRA|nr:hypothetical protein PHYPSEUDO_014816 [Phytophthora pseudosyringae]